MMWWSWKWWNKIKEEVNNRIKRDWFFSRVSNNKQWDHETKLTLR
jgi:hypothetical protein